MYVLLIDVGARLQKYAHKLEGGSCDTSRGMVQGSVTGNVRGVDRCPRGDEELRCGEVVGPGKRVCPSLSSKEGGSTVSESIWSLRPCEVRRLSGFDCLHRVWSDNNGMSKTFHHECWDFTTAHLFHLCDLAEEAIKGKLLVLAGVLKEGP